MLVGLLLVTLAFETWFFSRLDRKLFGTWITPFTVLAYPYLAVVCLAYLLAGPLDFVSLYPQSLAIWALGLCLIWATGAFLGWGLLDLRGSGWSQPGNGLASHNTPAVQKLASRLAWITLPLMAYGVVNSVWAAGGWSQIATPDFKAAYSSGIHGHAMVFSCFLTIVLIGVYKRRDGFQLLTIVLLLFFIALSQVKKNPVLAVLGGALFRLMTGRMQFSLKKAAALVAITYVIFNVIYLLGMVILSPENALDGATYAFLATHYLHYLFAGPLALSESLRLGAKDVGGDWSTIFAPFINLFHALARNHNLIASGSATEKGMTIDASSAAAVGTNVYTVFGTLYLYLGTTGAAIYTMVAGFFTYGLLVAASRRNQVWLTAAYCLIAAQLTLGFFDLYFWHLDFLEVLTAGIVLTLADRHWSSALRLCPKSATLG